MSSPVVTLKVTRSSVETTGRGFSSREFVLTSLDVYVDDVKVGDVESYVFRTDLTPNARTRRDGKPQRGWLSHPGKDAQGRHQRSMTRLATRVSAVEDVLERGAGMAVNAARDAARAAKVVKLSKTAK